VLIPKKNSELGRFGVGYFLGLQFQEKEKLELYSRDILMT